jgi:hypothetical protein
LAKQTANFAIPLNVIGESETRQSFRTAMAIIGAQRSLTLPQHGAGRVGLKRAYRTAMGLIAANLGITIPVDTFGNASFRANFVANMTLIDVTMAGGALPSLGALSLSGSLVIGSATSGAIIGATAGSTIVSNIPGITVNSVARTYSGTPTGSAQTIANGLVETLAGAGGSPRSSAVTVSAALVPLSGQALWADFTDASTLYADSARTTPATVGGPLLGVADKSGSGNHFTGVATTLTTDAGGKTAATFDGATAYMSADSLANSLLSGVGKSYTLYLVTRPDVEALGTPRTLFSSGRTSSDNPYQHLAATAAGRFFFQRRGDAGGSAVGGDVGIQTVGDLDYWMVVFSTNIVTVWKNGYCQRIATSVSTSTTTMDRFTLGALFRTTLTALFKGKMLELLVYAGAHTLAQVTTNDAYLRQKHLGETGKIPADLFCVSGQSNASGRATDTDFAANKPALAKGDAFEIDTVSGSIGNAVLGAPLGPDAVSNAPNFGNAWAQFAKTWKEQTGRASFWIGNAVGGTASMPTNDSSGTWDVIYRPNAGASLAGTAASRMAAAHNKLLNSPRYDYVDQAISVVHHQGEADTAHCYAQFASAYTLDGKETKGAFIANLVAMRDYYNATVPVKRFLVYEIGATVPPTEPECSLIRSAQAIACSIIPNGYLAYTGCKDFAANGYMKDTVHYKQGPVDALTGGYNAMGYGSAINAAAHRALETAAPSTPQLSVFGSVDVVNNDAGNVTATFLVLRSVITAGAVSVNWAVTGSGGSPAVAADFVGGVLPSGVVSFAAGEVLKLISVPVAMNAASAQGKGFTVTLSSPTGGALTSISSAPGTIN